MNGAVLVGHSRAHRKVVETLDRVAGTDAEVLLTGPTGVGKELYARYLHARSHRAGAPFVPVNCGGLGADLFENELFGHVGGAFTGAREARDGLVAAAKHGTLFLDELDALPAPSQVKLLRLVQHKEYRRLGEAELRLADLRFVAATNADLTERVRAGRFREDLMFRLRVVPVEIPPLRDRLEDLAPLCDRFIAWYAEQYRLAPVAFGASARRAMEGYAWPGNVRELENCIRYLTCIQIGRPIEPEDLLLLGPAPADAAGAGKLLTAKREVVEQLERDRVVAALRRAGGNIAQAARSEAMSRRWFYALMRKHRIDGGEFRGST